MRLRLSGQSGSVTLEAAFGIGASLIVFSLLLQGGTVAVAYVRALSVATEVAQFAAASGPIALRVDQAKAWGESQLEGARVGVEVGDSTVTALVSLELELIGGAWQPRLTASSSSPIVDRIAWSSA